MCLMSDIGLPLHALRAQIASAVDMIVHTARLRDGPRVVPHISEVQGYDPDRGYRIEDVFVRRYHGDDDKGKVVSTFEPTGFVPHCVETIHGHGLRIPDVIYAAAQAREAAYAQGAAHGHGHGHGHGGHHGG